jgi:hypothetical protein
MKNIIHRLKSIGNGKLEELTDYGRDKMAQAKMASVKKRCGAF